MDEELFDRETLTEAREALDWEVSDSRAVFGCLRIMMRGLLDAAIADLPGEERP